MQSAILSRHVRHLLLMFSLFSFTLLFSACDEDGSTDYALFEDTGSGGGGGGGGSGGGGGGSGGGGGGTSSTKLTFWSDFSGDPITVYVNGSYKGQITSYYTSTPSCNASGCVTVSFTGTGYISYSASDGNYTWDDSNFYVSSGCNLLNLTN